MADARVPDAGAEIAAFRLNIGRAAARANTWFESWREIAERMGDPEEQAAFERALDSMDRLGSFELELESLLGELEAGTVDLDVLRVKAEDYVALVAEIIILRPPASGRSKAPSR